MTRAARLHAWWLSAESSVQIHRWLKWLWVALVFPGIVWWRNSVPFLVGVSIYANIVGHWSSEQAGKVEVKQAESEGAVTDAVE